MALPTLLLTRPEASAQAFEATLDPAARAAVKLIIAPLMRIEGTGTVPELGNIGGVIFTSANGVAFAPEGRGRPAYCVGTQTTKRATERGWSAQMVGTCARELIATLLELRPATPLAHLGGENTVGDIAQSLSDAGIQTDHIALYRQQLLPLGAEARQALSGPTIVPVFSPRTAAQLVSEARGLLGSACIIALSDSVARPFDGEKLWRRTVLPAPEAIYMRKAVENLCLNLSLP